jgi:hypothetical protein
MTVNTIAPVPLEADGIILEDTACVASVLCACEIRFGDILEDLISVLWTKPVLGLVVGIDVINLSLYLPP